MNQKDTLPEWMLSSNNYIPEKDSDGFITKTMLSIGSVLSKARNHGNTASPGGCIPIKIAMILLLILLMALSKNMFFTYIVAAGTLVRICLLGEKNLKRVMGTALGAGVFSMIVLLPAVFFGSPKTMLTVSVKVFLSVSLIQILSVTSPWNQITGSLRAFHIPSIVILTLDITLKYIVLLGDLCMNMLTALKLRSVGKNKEKAHAFSGILGVTYLKSLEMSEEMYAAMVCRGFDGEYETYRKITFTTFDFLYIVVIILAVAAFIYLEGLL